MATSPEVAPTSLSAKKAGPAHVELHGEIDIATADRVVAAVANALEPWSVVTVDLSGVRFIDGRGITAFVRAQALAAEVGASMMLVNPQPVVRRVLQISGLLD